jgi:choline kinase
VPGLSAILLAAGVGRRLAPFTERHPKCLLEVAGQTLLRRHLELLRAAGIDDVTLVVGHLAEQTMAEAERGAPGLCRFVHNERYEAGSALSAACAAPVLTSGPTLLMDADLLYGRELLRRLVEDRAETCLLFDASSPDTGEEVKVALDERGRVAALGKRLTHPGRAAGESVGMFKLSQSAGSLLAAGLGEAAAQDPGIEYEPVIDGLLPGLDMAAVEVTGLPWTEIDFHEDVERARREVWPRLATEP